MPYIRSCRSYRKSSRNEGGFSILELMVALLLFSALGIAVWAGLAGGQNLVRRSVKVAAGTARLLQLERYIRQAALRVRTPFWEARPGAEAIGTGTEPGAAPGTGHGLRIPWVDGQSANFLVLEIREGRLRVQIGQGAPSMVFGPFQDVECSLYDDDSGQPAGLRVSVSPDAGDQTLIVMAPFGGSPLHPRKGP